MKVLIGTLVLLVLGASGFFLFRGYHSRSKVFCLDCALGRRHPSSERSSHAHLKTLATAQADFRANDRDGNGKPDFWRKDVAGLYTLKPPGSSEAIKLIELSSAAADDRPVVDIASYTTQGPKSGYWFRAVPHEGETTPDPDRFAFCAFPDSHPSAGRWTYLLSEENILWRKDLGRGGAIDAFPADPAGDGWKKLD